MAPGQLFSVVDKKAMLRFLAGQEKAGNPDARFPMGNRIWKLAEAMKITQHSYQSMQTHFRKYLYSADFTAYSLSSSEVKTLKFLTGQNAPPPLVPVVADKPKPISAKPPTAAAQTRPAASKPIATIKPSPKTNAAVKAKANNNNPAAVKPAEKSKAQPPIAKAADAIKASKPPSIEPTAAANERAKEATAKVNSSLKVPVAKAPPAALSSFEEEEVEDSSSDVVEIDDSVADEVLGRSSRPKPRLSSTPKKRKRRFVIDSDDETEEEDGSPKRAARESELFGDDMDDDEFMEAMYPDRVRAPAANTSQTPAATISPQTQTLLDVGLRTVTQLLQDKGTVSSTESNRPVPASAAKKAAPQMLAVAREDALLGDDLRTVNQQPLKNTAQPDFGRPAALAGTSELTAPSREPVPTTDLQPAKQHQSKSKNAVSGEPIDATAASTSQARTAPREKERPAAVLRTNQAANKAATAAPFIFPPPPRTYDAAAARKFVLESPPRGTGRRFFAAGKSKATQRLEARLQDVDVAEAATAEWTDAKLGVPNLRTSSRVSAALNNFRLEDEDLQAFMQALTTVCDLARCYEVPFRTVCELVEEHFDLKAVEDELISRREKAKEGLIGAIG